MEFLSGYAAAKAPYLTYQVEDSPQSRSKPSRSNSTSGAGRKKRSRIHGHVRTNSASTTSSGGRTEQQQQQQQQQDQHPTGWLQQTPTNADVDASGPGDDTTLAAAAPAAGGSGERKHNLSRRRNSFKDRDRMMPSGLKYFHDKQLPATPRLNTQDASAGKHLGGPGHHSEPPSARTPASATATTPSGFGSPAVPPLPDRRLLHTPAMAPYPDVAVRADSVSSISGAASTSSRTMLSGEQSHESIYQQRPFVVRNGRTYLADPTLPYPLPVDLEELHRQCLKTMLLMQLYGRPICAPAFKDKPPSRILDVGCGSGFWSMMCYKHYEARGQHHEMHFTGLDIVPLPPNAANGGATAPDKGMNWSFVQHDLRRLPLPFPDASFDFVMVKDMSLTTSSTHHQSLIEEYIRILTPGGTIEIWETDQLVRMLRPHVPDIPPTSGPIEDDPTPSASASASIISHDDDDTTSLNSQQQQNLIGGAYILTPNTPLSTPFNNFLSEYNAWTQRALDARALSTMPCTTIGPLLVQESEALAGSVGSRRLAVPLSDVRWEKEGVGGVVTKDGKKGTAGGGSAAAADVAGLGLGCLVGPTGKEAGSGSGRTLDPAGAALRRTALMVLVQRIQGLEPMLKEASGKSQDEWDTWVGKMMNDLVREHGTSWGECLEVGAWWAKKR
ncbi:hypothetical protein VTJ49DRAFT_6534 [Mycothermus thermophilus]|uniref:Methyltransferase domain-containing protein n=1 Tax=Humicola insolens TaxID=85995 RepID=A0ABR3V171_HUMIN